jgi:hypothetical protein
LEGLKVQGFKKTGQKLLLLVCSISLMFMTLEIGMRIWICHFASERHVLKYASVKQLEKKRRIGAYLIEEYWLGIENIGHFNEAIKELNKLESLVKK